MKVNESDKDFNYNHKSLNIDSAQIKKLEGSGMQ